jgi:phage shock protein C
LVCLRCGREIGEATDFCSICGARQHLRNNNRRLTLSATDGKIAGVCGGIAEYLDVDSTIVRLIWAALSVVPGGLIGGVLAYLLAWIIIPRSSLLASTAMGEVSAQPHGKAS